MKRQLTLKLIESNDKPTIGDITLRKYCGLGILNKECLDEEDAYSYLEDKVIKPIAISDEEIKVGDMFITEKNDICKCSNITEYSIYFYQSDDYEYVTKLKGCKKIELLPEHFSNDILQLIVDGKLKDGDTIEVAIDTYNNQIMFDERGCASISIPESNTNEVSKIMYSEEEVKELLSKLINSHQLHRGIQIATLLPQWFEDNKK